MSSAPVETPEFGHDHPALAPGHAQLPHEADTSRLHPPQRQVRHTLVSADPLDVDLLAASVSDQRAGAVVTFVGAVRDHDHGRAVEFIEYVGHPTAGRILEEVVGELTARSSCEAVAVAHRVGELRIGEVAFFVAVSAAHRQEAFSLAAALVDEVKHRLPVWKRQVFPDGDHEWVACP